MTNGLLIGAVSLTTSQQIVFYVVDFACAVVGYLLARRMQQVRGVPPWRIPPVVWGLIGALASVFGIVIELAAWLTTRAQIPPPATEYRPTGPPPPPHGPAGMWPPPGAPWGSAPPPAPGTAMPGAVPPANAPVGGSPDFPLPVAPGLPGPDGWQPAPFGPEGPPPLFGWYGDPTTRHEHRYWDGRQWSDKVSDAGERSEDPLEP